MKHLVWDYKGYNDISKGGIKIHQPDWNATILAKFNQAYGDNFENGYNIFASKHVIDTILKTIEFDEKTNTIFKRKVIPLDIDTPKIYITKSEIDKFSDLSYNNYGSVTILNFKRWQ